MIKFLDEMPFAKHLRDFEIADKLELLRRFELKHIKAGNRLFEDSDQFSCMYLVISGKIGIFYPD